MSPTSSWRFTTPSTQSRGDMSLTDTRSMRLRMPPPMLRRHEEGMSTSAAAIEAAYQVLFALLPDQQTYLNTQYAGSMGAIPNGAGKTNGQIVGQASASTLLALRAGDGLGAKLPYTWPLAPVPGVWIPTPPAFAKPQTPWLGQMRPFTFDDPAMFLPDEPPPDLSSDTWA